MANGNESPEKKGFYPPISEWQSTTLHTDREFVNVGPDDEPLWVNPDRVDAVGIHGKGALVVLASGAQLVAKGKTPSEVAQLLVHGGEEA